MDPELDLFLNYPAMEAVRPSPKSAIEEWVNDSINTTLTSQRNDSTLTMRHKKRSNRSKVSIKEPTNLVYKGTIHVNDTAFYVEICKRGGGYCVGNASVLFPGKAHTTIKRQCRQPFATVAQCLHKLTAHLRVTQPTYTPCPTALYRRLLHDYKEFTNFYLYIDSAHLLPDLSGMRTTYKDEARRLHSCTMHIEGDGGAQHHFRLGDYDLPNNMVEVVRDDTLIGLYDQFAVVVEACARFFAAMDAIDAHCWVVEPPETMRRHSHVHRRIMLRGQLSAVLTFNVNEPTALPAVRLCGRPSQVDAMARRLVGRYTDWSPEGDIIEELLKLFDLDNFPLKTSSWIVRNLTVDSADDAFVESGIPACGICMVVYSEGSDCASDVFCANTPCMQCFHTECLRQWMKSNRRADAGKRKATCPYCTSSITYPNRTK